MYETKTVETESRTIGSVMVDIFFLFLALSALGVVVTMGIGMVLDDAAFMLFFPIILAVPTLGLVSYTVTDVITGNAGNILARLFSKSCR